MQPMWLCLFSGRQFEVTFEKTHRGKVKQMQPVWVWLLWSKFFEVSYEITQWRKVKQMQPVHNVYIGQFFSFRPRAVGHIVQPRDRHIIEHIWKYTLEKSRTNATSVSLTALIQALWGLTWKYTVTTPHILSQFRRLAWQKKPFRHNFTNIMSANIDPPPYIHHTFVVRGGLKVSPEGGGVSPNPKFP